jgi:hypothetical protein
MPLRALTPEARFVFRSADPTCPAAELANAAAGVTDWPRALTLSEREGATPALWRALQHHQPPINKEARYFLQLRTQVSDFRMQQLSQQLQLIVRCFAERGIPVILLKGAAVGALGDPTFRQRPMTDLDLLVRSADLERASKAVVDSGWPMTTDLRLLELLQDQHHLPPFVSPLLPGLRLELHIDAFAPGQGFALSLDALWRDARPAPAPFTGASVLSPEHMFVHMCAHFAWQHAMKFGAWRTYRSIAAVAALPEFSWDAVVRTARATKTLTVCYWTLRLAQRLSGLVVPDQVMTQLAPPTPEWVRRMLTRHFVADVALGEGPTSPSVKLSHWLWRAAIRPRWSGHAAPQRIANDHRWERAFGTFRAESRWSRYTRHAASYRAGWGFFSHLVRG